jgi:hypothetical protein
VRRSQSSCGFPRPQKAKGQRTGSASRSACDSFGQSPQSRRRLRIVPPLPPSIRPAGVAAAANYDSFGRGSRSLKFVRPEPPPSASPSSPICCITFDPKQEPPSPCSCSPTTPCTPSADGSREDDGYEPNPQSTARSGHPSRSAPQHRLLLRRR